MHRATVAAPATWALLAVSAAMVGALIAGALGAGATGAVIGQVVARVGMDVSGVGCVGLLLLLALLPAGREHAEARAGLRTTVDRGCLGLGSVWLVLTALTVGFRTATATGRPITEVTLVEVVRWSSELAAGRGTVLAGVCAAVVAVCAVSRVRRPDRVPDRVMLAAAMLGLLAPSVTGHVGGEGPSHTLAMLMIGLHVMAMAPWVGGLGALLALLSRRRSLLIAALPRFSGIAGVCIAVVAVTGVVSAALRLPSPEALLNTGSGVLITIKALFLVTVGMLGASVRWQLIQGRATLPRWVGTEMVVMALTVGLAAALGQVA